MLTTAVRSTTGRSSVGGRGGAAPSSGDAGSSSRGGPHRRSRSLSRCSGRFPPPSPEPDDFPTPRGRFVNKLRGSGFLEISVDDLADEFFRARAESEEEDSEPSAARSRRRRSVASYLMETESSRQRGRPVSRPPDRGAALPKGRSMSRPPDRRAAPPKGVSDSVSRRRRSASVARHRCSDPENDMDSPSSNIQVKARLSGYGKLQQPPSHRPVKDGDALKRSMSQKDFFHSHDSYSSHSSSLTDDESRDFRSRKCGVEKTIQAVFAQEKGENPIGDDEGIALYEVMRKEVRHAVKEIRTELEKVMVINEPSTIISGDGLEPKSSEVLQTIAEIRRNYTSKLEQSEKRKQDLLAELAMEEERGQELSKIVKELLPSPKKPVPEGQSRSRRRSNDRTRVSKHLTEEAEKYFEDFLFNVEDTDISSFDGERSDTSSNIRDPGLHYFTAETHERISRTTPLPADADGVLLPWLQWEASTGPFSPSKSKAGIPVSSGNYLSASPLAAQEASAGFSSCNQIASSVGSWSPIGNGSSSVVSRDRSRSKLGIGNRQSSTPDGRRSVSSFDMDEYQKLKETEDLLFERLRQRQRIESGCIILCGRLLT